MDIILIGAPGAGKGTQATILSQALSIRHISSGDLFRKAFDDKAALQTQKYIDRAGTQSDFARNRRV